MKHAGLWWRKRKQCPSSRRVLCVSLSVWVGLLVLGAPGWPAEPSVGGENPCTDVSEGAGPTAEVIFPIPRPFVIIAGAPEDGRWLYGAGESIPHVSNVEAEVRILRIDPGHVQVQSGGKAAVWLKPGDPLPGVRGLVVEGTTVLVGLHYRYRVAAQSPKPEPKLLCVRAAHAQLEVTVPGTPQSGRSSAEATEATARAETGTSVSGIQAQRRDASAAAPLAEVAPHTYQVDAKNLQELLDRGARMVAETWGGGWLPASTAHGEPQGIESPVADGLLGPRGFRLTSPKMAEVAGLETGDLILAVDGQAVNTFADLYQAYQQVRRAARRPRFEVTLERNGVQVTKTYLIQ